MVRAEILARTAADHPTLGLKILFCRTRRLTRATGLVREVGDGAARGARDLHCEHLPPAVALGDVLLVEGPPEVHAASLSGDAAGM